MKKGFLSVILVVVLVVASAISLTACGGEETYNNISAQSNPYSAGTQSIEITASSSIVNDEPEAKFKQTVSAADIELGGALEGKTVTKVVYNSETSVTVTLEGNTKTKGGDNAYGTITVKQSGMASKGNSTCTVRVLVPEIQVTYYACSQKTSGDVTVYSIVAKLVLPVGAFTNDATAENVSLESGADGELSVELEDDMLVVTVKNCSKKHPSINLKAAVTTFGKEVNVVLSSASSTEM